MSYFINNVLIQGYVASEPTLFNSAEYFKSTFTLYIPPIQIRPSTKTPVVAVKESIPILVYGYNALARYIKAYVKKGDMIYIEGKIGGARIKDTNNKNKQLVFINAYKVYRYNNKTGGLLDIEYKEV